jgi:hypothetical protein
MNLHRTIPVLAATILTLAWTAPASAASCGTEDLVAGKKPYQSQDAKGDLALITDGAVGAEGTQWDAPVVVTLETPAGSVTYDLGEARQVSALVVQADANDTYKVSGSVDGAPGSYKVLAELPNVVDRGHGLRTRTVEIPPATLRYLRVGEGQGDGFYSISELAAYCKKPSPFPPALKVVEAPKAGEAVAAPPPKDGGRSVLVLVAALLGLAWLVYRTLHRSKAAGGGPAPPSAPDTSSGPGASGESGGPGESGGGDGGGGGAPGSPDR